jgi:hypothetical protein
MATHFLRSDSVFKHQNILAVGALGLAFSFAVPAQAATLLGIYSGTDCDGGQFSNCFATQTGVNIEDGALSSPVVVKYNGSQADDPLAPFEVDEISSNYPSVDGTEFVVSFDEMSNILSFTYTPGISDPEIHYFAIKQGSQYALYYDANPIIGDSIDLDGLNFRAGTDAFSHITFFNSGSTPGVPEPSTWAMMLLGFGAIGFAMRRRRQTSGDRIRVRFAV